MATIRASVERISEWAKSLPGCRVRLGDGLSDEAIDAAFAAITPYYSRSESESESEFEFRPRGGYREFLRAHDGLTVEVEVDGEFEGVEAYMFRIFDLATIARLQRELVLYRSPLFEVGVGKSKREVWLSRNHLVAFAGGEHAPDALWVFDGDAEGEEHPIYQLDQDAGFGGPLLVKDREGAWVGEAPVSVAASFEEWLQGFAEMLEGVDPRDYV